MRRPRARWSGPLFGLGVLGVVVWRVGPAPFLDAVHHLDATALAIALTITLATTLASAYRWTVVARVLGVDLSLASAVRAYYRSQLLNTVLPGGVLGDAERGLRHGRDVGARGQALRSVVWERGAGQAVQLLVTAGVLLFTTSFGGPGLVLVGAPVVVGLVLAGVTWAVAATWWQGLTRRLLETMAGDVRLVLLAWRVWPRVILASLLVVSGHVTVFVVAVRAVGVTASARTVVPAALVVLAASAVPASFAGWGPREGAAAAVFAASGLGSGVGVGASAVYGVLVLGSVLPGVVPIVVARVAAARRSLARPQPAAVTASAQGVGSGG